MMKETRINVINDAITVFAVDAFEDFNGEWQRDYRRHCNMLH